MAELQTVIQEGTESSLPVEEMNSLKLASNQELQDKKTEISNKVPKNTKLTDLDVIREKESEFAKKLVESAQTLAHHDLSQLQQMSTDLCNGANDEDKALQLAILGGEFMERNRFNDSDKLLKKSFKVYREVTGMDNVAILLRLACLYQQKNSTELAEKFLQKSLNISTQRPVAESIVLNCHIGLVTNYQLAGDLEKADQYCKYLLESNGSEKSRSKNPLLHSLVLTVEGSILLQKNQYQKAQRKLSEALKLHKDYKLEVTDHSSQTYLLLIRTHRMSNKFDAAEKIANEALELLQAEFGNESWEVGLVLLALADIKHSSEKWHEAIEFYKQTFKIYRKICGKIHPNVATIYFQLGDIMAEMGKFEDGVIYLRKAIALIEKWEQKNEVKCGTILAEYYYSLYWVYFLWQRYPEAHKYLEKSVKILEDLAGDAENEWDAMRPVMLSNLKIELEGFVSELESLKTSGKLSNGTCPKRLFKFAFSKQIYDEKRVFM